MERTHEAAREPEPGCAPRWFVLPASRAVGWAVFYVYAKSAMLRLKLCAFCGQPLTVINGVVQGRGVFGVDPLGRHYVTPHSDICPHGRPGEPSWRASR